MANSYLVPDHSPEIRRCGRHGALSGYVIFGDELVTSVKSKELGSRGNNGIGEMSL